MMARFHEIPIMALDRARAELVGTDGFRYAEIVESIWAPTGVRDIRCVYLQTMTHGGGICLRPLYVREGDTWVNATTASEAPSSLDLTRRVAILERTRS